MSYILDALNKSERERNRKKGPGINPVDEARTSAGVQTRHLVAIFLGVLVVNGIGLYLFLGDRLTDMATSRNDSTAEHTVANTTTNSTTTTADTPSAGPIKVQDVTAESPSVRRLPAVSLDDLPVDIRSELPELDITTHIFASEADLRMVRVNGRPYHQGDRLAPELELIEITDTGIIIGLREHQVIIEVVEDWQLAE